MPELPEVETVRNSLRRHMVGQQIVSVDTRQKNYFFVTAPAALTRRLSGRTIIELDRIGKYIIAELDDDSKLLLHLGMTGQFSASQTFVPWRKQNEHVHVVLHLSNQFHISLRDVRKFGKIEWIGPGRQSKRLAKLGPDALLTSTDHLLKCFSKRKIPIKTAILDQAIWAGVGNIYADEGLFRSKLNPLKLATSLRRAQVETLRSQVQDLLQLAIKAGGSTINDYIKPDGELGGFQDFHKVYGKTGEACPHCRQAICRIVIGGRSTHYCPRCQK